MPALRRQRFALTVGGSEMPASEKASERAGMLTVDGAALAWRGIAGDGPAVIWLGGFHSDMTGTKAQALADWANLNSRAFVRFDYFGHGQSEGAFEDGTITRWRGDVLA